MSRESYYYRPGVGEVYKISQTSKGETYEGTYRGNGGKSIRNSIRTVGARQAARTARVFRNTPFARESTVPSLRQSGIDFEGANDLFNRRTNRSERMIDSRNASNFNARMRAAEERWRRNNPNF